MDRLAVGRADEGQNKYKASGWRSFHPSTRHCFDATADP
jgi:hypothetical protein